MSKKKKKNPLRELFDEKQSLAKQWMPKGAINSLIVTDEVEDVLFQLQKHHSVPGLHEGTSFHI